MLVGSKWRGTYSDEPVLELGGAFVGPIEAFQNALNALFKVESREVEAGYAALVYQTFDQPYGQGDAVVLDLLVVVLDRHIQVKNMTKNEDENEN